MIINDLRVLKFSVNYYIFFFFILNSKCWACETLPSSLHIIKEIHGQSGQLERTCEGEVAVSKCEGSCSSKVRPSALSHSGFIKDCQCCRESSLRVREVLLSKCFDPDGISIHGDKENFIISLREPADCKCFSCGELIGSRH